MKSLSKALLFIMLGCLFFSCKREVITKEPTLADTSNKIAGYWRGKYLEQELYSGNVMTSKTLITSNLNSIEYKKDFTYTSVFETQAPESGTWELISSSYLHLDKGKPNDRYYHIISLDDKTLVYRGPFDVNGNTKFGYLITVYNFR